MEWYPCSYSGEGTENRTVTFTQAEKRENIKSGEKHKTIFGKIARWFADLKPVAFTGNYSDLSGKPSSLPVSDVSAWAKAASKPLYSWNEIGGKPSSFTPSSHAHVLGNITDLSKILEVGDDGLVLKENSEGEISILIEPSFNTYYAFMKIKDRGSKIQFRGAILDVSSYYKVGIFAADSEENGIFFLKYSDTGRTCLMPSADGMTYLGHSDYRWKDIYSINSAISTSDREVKKEISYIGDTCREDSSTYMDDMQLISLILGLKACVYKFKENDSSRPHHGLIAQDVEELLQKLGIKDHAAFIKSPKTKDVEVEEEYTDEDGRKKTRKRAVQEEIPGEYIYGLRYEEFISDIIRFCQILYSRSTGLKTTLEEQKEKAESQEKRIEALENIIKQMV